VASIGAFLRLTGQQQQGGITLEDLQRMTPAEVQAFLIQTAAPQEAPSEPVPQGVRPDFGLSTVSGIGQTAKSPYERTLRPGEARSAEDLQDMLAEVILAAGSGAVPAAGPRGQARQAPGRVRPGHEKQFEAWFGDSKAVDARGRPLTVYHGGPETIREFKSGREGGIFLASHPSVAGEYADARRGATYPAHLSMQNPLIHDAAAGFKRNDALVREARSKGHDGVIIRNTYDGIRNDGRSPLTDVFIVFDPTQIKSATGNRGTYSPASGDIRE
jgi:hypothetical protein